MCVHAIPYGSMQYDELCVRTAIFTRVRVDEPCAFSLPHRCFMLPGRSVNQNPYLGVLLKVNFVAYVF